MPTYQYRCKDCSHEFEQMQKITDQPLIVCPNCQKDSLVKVPGGGIGLSLRGSGFYANDYGSNKPESNQKGGCCPCGKKNSCSQ